MNIPTFASSILDQLDWKIVDLFQETVHIADLTLESLGLVAKKREKTIVASAAGIEKNSYERAYFELIERAITQDSHSFDEINSDPFRLSKSNGVSFHFQYELACDAARNELIERHLVLHSWLGLHPLRILTDKPWFSENLQDLYRSVLVDFGSAAGIQVRGCFLLPKQSNLPLVSGFAAANDPKMAIQKAELESMQRLAFLYGEDLPDQDPDFEPSPMYHQDYHLMERNHLLINEWIAKAGNESYCDESQDDIVFMDLTPKRKGMGFYVVQAQSEKYLPLIFGRIQSHPRFTAYPRSCLVHPIA